MSDIWKQMYANSNKTVIFKTTLHPPIDDRCVIKFANNHRHLSAMAKEFSSSGK